MTAGADSLHLCCNLEGQNRHVNYTLSKYLARLVLSPLIVAEINRFLMVLKRILCQRQYYPQCLKILGQGDKSGWETTFIAGMPKITLR